jgi:hypothetical protein
MDNSFTAERRRVVSEYACAACGVTHALNIPPGYTLFCSSCGRPQVVCNADVRGGGSGVAGAVDILRELRTRPIEEQQMVAATFEGALPTPTVSLPSEAEQATAPVEDTQVEITAVLCGYCKEPYHPGVPCIPPPSGWRDRPGLL